MLRQSYCNDRNVYMHFTWFSAWQCNNVDEPSINQCRFLFITNIILFHKSSSSHSREFVTFYYFHIFNALPTACRLERELISSVLFTWRWNPAKSWKICASRVKHQASMSDKNLLWSIFRDARIPGKCSRKTASYTDKWFVNRARSIRNTKNER